MNDTIKLSTARVFDLYNQDWVGITCTGNLGVPLAVFVYWVLYICVESYIHCAVKASVVVFLVQLYVSHRSLL